MSCQARLPARAPPWHAGGVSEAGAPDAEWIRRRIGELTGQEISRPPRILDDTTEFMGIDPGSPDFDLWSVGNVLHVVAARRVVRIRDVLDTQPDLAGRIGPADASLFFPYRLMNLGALYPWLPRPFTEILRRFAVGDCPRYRTVDEVADDLQAVVEAPG